MGILELLILIVLICWLAGWGFGVGGSLIHLLLVLLIVVIVIRALQGRNPVP